MSDEDTASVSRFRKRSRNVTIAAIVVGLVVIAPLVLEIPRTRGPGMAGQLVTGLLAGAGIAWVVWSSAWTLPALLGAARARLGRAGVPGGAIVVVLVATLPLLLAAAAAYGVLGGGVRERRRARDAAAPGTAAAS